jgi:hypothetical protein
MITNEQLREWRAVCDKATPGPWRCECADICADNGRLVADFVPHGEDSDFIVIARDALPALLDENQRLRALLREWNDKCKGHCDTESIAEQVEALK